MNRICKSILLLILASGAIIGSIWFLKTQTIPVLFPKGFVGLEERDLFLYSTLIMLIVVIPVFVLTFIFAYKYRASNNKAAYRPD